MMAARRSAARSARLDAGLGEGFEEAGPLFSARRLASFGAASSGSWCPRLSSHNMTDRSVIVKTEMKDRSHMGVTDMAKSRL